MTKHKPNKVKSSPTSLVANISVVTSLFCFRKIITIHTRTIRGDQTSLKCIQRMRNLNYSILPVPTVKQKRISSVTGTTMDSYLNVYVASTYGVKWEGRISFANKVICYFLLLLLLISTLRVITCCWNVLWKFEQILTSTFTSKDSP